ncbi:hypothetical protein CHELA40_40218 [Chelatococcus asaccharovorans]|nr:hypothetical protein CHELA17_50241 [Chelatococcus asaccharovorans]CAH1690365.1 hypothetical protein CHELA40_40218 [Chelatococcus asaccharovorans]
MAGTSGYHRSYIARSMLGRGDLRSVIPIIEQLDRALSELAINHVTVH